MRKTFTEITHLNAEDAPEFLSSAAGLTTVRRADGMIFECTTSDRWFSPGKENVYSVESLTRRGDRFTVLYDPRVHD